MIRRSIRRAHGLKGSVKTVWAKSLAKPGSTPQPSLPPPRPVEPYGSSVPRTPFVPPNGGQSGQQPGLSLSGSQSRAAPNLGHGGVQGSGGHPANYIYAVTQQAGGRFGFPASQTPQGGRGQPSQPSGDPPPVQPQPRDGYSARTHLEERTYRQSSYMSSSPFPATASAHRTTATQQPSGRHGISASHASQGGSEQSLQPPNGPPMQPQPRDGYAARTTPNQRTCSQTMYDSNSPLPASAHGHTTHPRVPQPGQGVASTPGGATPTPNVDPRVGATGMSAL